MVNYLQGVYQESHISKLAGEVEEVVDPLADYEEGIFIFRKNKKCCQIPVGELQYLQNYS